ncbi:MAG: RnfABCDGE type electron transport complex subunit A [Treponema sp.]|jgi:electron transport complex protein RnfA|nr:RnfABCDGE type electron transport complex subunit A [Treponema sp.]
MDIQQVIVILMGTVFINNYVLNRFLGVCPFLGVTKQLRNSIGMGASITFVMVLATIVTWPIMIFVLQPNGLSYLQVIVFVLVIASLVQLVEIALKRYVPSLFKAFGVFLPLMATNCAILAVTIENINLGYTFAASIVNAFGAGVGFLLAMVIFSGIREQTENADPPGPFKDLPITLFSVAILSLSFFGFFQAL